MNKGIIVIGDDFRCSSGDFSNAIGSNLCSFIRCDKGSVVSIGDNVGMSSSVIRSKVGVRIGNFVKIGAQCVITDTDGHSLDPAIRKSIDDNKNAKSKPVVIGDNVWLGMRCIVCKGVTIGENSVIGAGSVVVHSVPANQIWAGNPAKFVRQI